MSIIFFCIPKRVFGNREDTGFNVHLKICNAACFSNIPSSSTQTMEQPLAAQAQQIRSP